MDIEHLKQLLKSRPNMANAMGIDFVSTPDPLTCEAHMCIDDATCQPFGYMNGGAALALAENLAGVGSAALCPDKIPMGLNVTACHLKAVPVGQTVRAVAHILHQGNTTHVWNVDVIDAHGQLASTLRVTNFMVTPTKRELEHVMLE